LPEKEAQLGRNDETGVLTTMFLKTKRSGAVFYGHDAFRRLPQKKRLRTDQRTQRDSGSQEKRASFRGAAPPCIAITLRFPVGNGRRPKKLGGSQRTLPQSCR